MIHDMKKKAAIRRISALRRLQRDRRLLQEDYHFESERPLWRGGCKECEDQEAVVHDGE
jgi:hypothetical protein